MFYYWSKLLKKIRCSAIKSSFIDKTSKVEAGSLLVNVKMGRHSFCGYDCEIANCNIGSFCSIASNVVIGGGMHPMDWVSMSPVFYYGKDSVKAKFSQHHRLTPLITTIEHDVWIGRGLIKQGVTIGTGAVIGMGSVVTNNVKPYEIVAGNPAKHIRNRFGEEVIVALYESNWWLLADGELFKYAEYINSPADFIMRFKK